jgi:phosphotransacetylase
MGYTNFDEVLSDAARLKNTRVAVACAHERSVMEALYLAQCSGLAQPVLIGDADIIEVIAGDIGYTLEPRMVSR